MDVEVKTSKRGTLRRIWRWTVNITVVLFLFAGFMQVIGQPVLRAINNTGATVKATTVDTPAAQETAVRAVTDWLTYNPQANTTYRAITAKAFTNGDTVNAWSGSGWMAPDIVTAGTVTQQPNTTATVEVTARVRLATPNDSAQPPAAAGPAGGAPANDPTLPAGWTVAGTQWLHLIVPVTLVDGQVKANGTGPVFAPGNPPLTVTPGANADNDATTSSKQWATSLFTALAGTDPTALSYLTVNPIVPLNGQVTLAAVGTWQVQTPAEGETGRVATAAVTWKLPTVDLQVKQTYTVEAINQGGRWAASTITATTGGTQ